MKQARPIKMCLNETYSRVWVDKHLSDTFLIMNGLKQGDSLQEFLFNLALEYSIRRVQATRKPRNLNDTCQIVVHADDVNILRRSIYTLKKNTEILVVTSKEIGLEVNAEKTKYMIISREQHAGQNHNINRGYKSFETVEQFRYLGTTLANQNFIHKDIKNRFNSGNANYQSVQNLLYSTLLSTNTKIKI
jgi:hypothetical protein